MPETNYINKVYHNNQAYNVGGVVVEWQEVVYLTQEEYDALPASKLTDGKIYKIKTSGVAPTPGGGTTIESGNMLLTKINYASDNDSLYISKFATWSNVPMYNNAGIMVRNPGSSLSSFKFAVLGWDLYLTDHVSVDYIILKVNLTTWTSETFYTYQSSSIGAKFADYIYTRDWTTYEKIDYEGNATVSSQAEYDAIPGGLYYKGLFYSQDNNDYVAVDSTGTEVKRYSNVWTINGIYDDKLYRNVGDVAYAIATI